MRSGCIELFKWIHQNGKNDIATTAIISSMALAAQIEHDLISSRPREALAVRKAQGIQIEGSPDVWEMPLPTMPRQRGHWSASVLYAIRVPTTAPFGMTRVGAGGSRGVTLRTPLPTFPLGASASRWAGREEPQPVGRRCAASKGHRGRMAKGSRAQHDVQEPDEKE